MFAIENSNRIPIRHRPSGRLMRPSDHQIATHGLGELDGVMDILKNFGTGVVKTFTAGIYDPSKNRFYVPFSSGQMRGWAQGITNTATLGLVKTDKFFASQTVRTIGTVAGALAATGVAVAGASYLSGGKMAGGSNWFGPGTPSPSALPGSATVYGPPSPIVAAAPSTSSLLSNVKTGLEVLNTGAKLMGAAQGGGVPPQMPGGGGAPGVIVMTGDNPTVLPQNYGYDPNIGYGMMLPGAGVYQDPGSMMMLPSGGGGGGPMGPPGSEFGSMEQQQQGGPVQAGSSMVGTVAVLGGGAALLYFLLSD